MPTSTFTDPRGRRITVSDLTIVGQLRLVRLIGGENATFFAICKKLALVDSIDDEDIPFPRNILAFEKVARKLGDDGLMALTLHLAERDALKIPDPAVAPGPADAPGAPAIEMPTGVAPELIAEPVPPILAAA